MTAIECSETKEQINDGDRSGKLWIDSVELKIILEISHFPYYAQLISDKIHQLSIVVASETKQCPQFQRI